MSRYTYGPEPKETIWNGVHYRSRLEARWAIFFSVLGVEVQYEPVMLTNRVRNIYLPDFYLKPWNCFFEVKPTAPTRKEIQKAQLLSLATDTEVHITTTTFYDARLFDNLRFFTIYHDRPKQEVRLKFCPRCSLLDFFSREHGCEPDEPNPWQGIKVKRRQASDAFVAAVHYRFGKKETPQ